MKQAELYGFVGWISSMVIFVLYLLWGFVPDKIWHSIGIYYYPDRAWALTLPSVFCMTLLFIWLLFQTLNLAVTKEINSPHLILDKLSKVYDKKVDKPDMGPEIHDLPPGVVNNALYYQENVINKYRKNT